MLARAVELSSKAKSKNRFGRWYSVAMLFVFASFFCISSEDALAIQVTIGPCTYTVDEYHTYIVDGEFVSGGATLSGGEFPCPEVLKIEIVAGANQGGSGGGATNQYEVTWYDENGNEIDSLGNAVEEELVHILLQLESGNLQ